MGMEFYGDDYRGADVAPFVGINTFLHLPWIKTHEELKQAKPDDQAGGKVRPAGPEGSIDHTIPPV